MAHETREEMIAALAEDLPGEEMRAALERKPLPELRRLRMRQLAAEADIRRYGQLGSQWNDGLPT